MNNIKALGLGVVLAVIFAAIAATPLVIVTSYVNGMLLALGTVATAWTLSACFAMGLFGDVVLLHRTRPEHAAAIRENGFKAPFNEAALIERGEAAIGMIQRGEDRVSFTLGQSKPVDKMLAASHNELENVWVKTSRITRMAHAKAQVVFIFGTTDYGFYVEAAPLRIDANKGILPGEYALTTTDKFKHAVLAATAVITTQTNGLVLLGFLEQLKAQRKGL